MNHQTSRKKIYLSTLLLTVAAITILFLFMIKDLLLTVFLTGIFTMLIFPLYERFLKWFRGRKRLASIATVISFVVFIGAPVAALLSLITAQAFNISKNLRPRLEEFLKTGSIDGIIQRLPYHESLRPYLDLILKKAGELVGAVSSFVVDSLSVAAVGTLNFFFLFFIFLYAMYFFLIDGKKLINKILYYFPLPSQDEGRLMTIFGSVTRATIKGTLVIGILQGFLAGLAFTVVGIPAAAFWGTIMAFFSFIPGVGAPLVWVPAVIILMIQNQWCGAIGLALFCGLAVGSVDNLLRPRLVGRDTKMHDFLILLSTLGGITLFGVLGFIVGPIVAALFVSIWEIYGEVFREYLPDVGKEKA
jgi:predicted PurR-regulated permease PerM